EVIPVLQDISTSLQRADHLFHAILHEVDLSVIRSKGLHYLSSEELEGVNQFLKSLGPIVDGNADGNWWALNLGQMTRGLAMRLSQEASAPATSTTPAEIELERLTGGLLATLS